MSQSFNCCQQCGQNFDVSLIGLSDKCPDCLKQPKVTIEGTTMKIEVLVPIHIERSSMETTHDKVKRLMENLNPVGLDNLGLVIYSDLDEKLSRGVQLEDHDIQFINTMHQLKFGE